MDLQKCLVKIQYDKKDRPSSKIFVARPFFGQKFFARPVFP